MNTVALLLVVSSLVLSAVAYWRSGGAQDVQKLRGELATLQLKQKALTESIAGRLAATYGRSRARLHAAREGFHRLKTETVDGMETQLQLTQDHRELLGQRLEEAAGSVKNVALATAQRIEEAIALRVRRFEARASLLQAKARASRAQAAAAQNDFQRADELLGDAANLFQAARETLAADRTYDLQLEAMKQDLRAATSAVRSRAQDTRLRIDRVLADTDRIVGALESDETRAAASPQV